MLVQKILSVVLLVILIIIVAEIYFIKHLSSASQDSTQLTSQVTNTQTGNEPTSAQVAIPQTDKKLAILSESQKVKVASFDEAQLQKIADSFQLFNGNSILIPVPKNGPFQNAKPAPFSVSQVTFVLTDAPHPLGDITDNTIGAESNFGIVNDSATKHLVIRLYTSLIKSNDKQKISSGYEAALAHALWLLSVHKAGGYKNEEDFVIQKTKSNLMTLE